jgi:antibiotic biosynthesis monooxygenase (ABM) superfamily enzyme
MLHQRGASLLFALRTAHEDAAACAARLEALNAHLAAENGFVSLDVVRRQGGLGTDFYVVARFANAACRDAWRASPDRKAYIEDIEALSIADISRQCAEGAMVWFEPIESMPSPKKPPPLWKRWLLSFVAVYPPLVVLVAALSPLTEGLPVAVRLLLVAAILTGVTTAFFIPWLNRMLAGWLQGA